VKKKENLSDLDKAQWKEYTKNPKDIFDKDLEEKKSFNINYRFRFDLHGFTLSDANKKIHELIINCHEKNFKEILLITGKGLHSNSDQNTYVSKKLSKLKFSVPEYINTQKDLLDKVFSIKTAAIKDGGEGAIIIKLKNL
jgi:DNA-nicking Smr family endonuclease|tara:strand:- start:1121 stop:1540 length:420 start_codon:yes stop_codon:yes gene_type:complete